MKKLIMFGLILLILPIISSQLIFEKDSSVNISIPCSWNETECSVSASCNYSIFNSYQTKIKNGSLTVDSESFFIIQLNTTNTYYLGEYIIDLFCYDQNVGSFTTIEFKVTPNGKELSLPQGIMYIFLLILSVLVFLALIMGSIKFPWKNIVNDDGKLISVNDLKWAKLACIIFSYLTLLFITGLIYTISEDYLNLGGPSSFFYVIHRILLALVYPSAVIIPWLILIMVVADKKSKKFIERGLSIR